MTSKYLSIKSEQKYTLDANHISSIIRLLFYFSILSSFMYCKRIHHGNVHQVPVLLYLSVLVATSSYRG